jgi:signal recognition particle receptor subunit beta
MVRNLTEDDYDDYYDDDDYDDYEEEDSTQQQYAPPTLKQQQQQQQTSTKGSSKPTTAPAAFPAPNIKIAVAGKTATTASVGVAKPPPGWGKPTPPSSATAAAGVSQPTPGWGKPAPPSSNNNANAGVAKPPPGWGKPTPPSSVAAASGAAAGAAAAGGATKSSTKGTSTKAANNSSSSNAAYKAKPLPDVLKNAKSQLSMVVLGHVDAGKSTLMGQLLVQVGQVTKRNAQKQNLSWFLDENESERQRGVTMEIGTKGMSTKTHDIIILDAPGHADFIPIMITGAANADVAILVVAAVRGEFEAGFDGGGQTKEHVLLARGLGVSQVLVAVNKLDVDGWEPSQAQGRYDDICRQVKDYLLQQQFAPQRIRFVPLSGLTGENVSHRKDPDLCAWYKGPTLLEAMDAFQPANRQIGTYPTTTTMYMFICCTAVLLYSYCTAILYCCTVSE